MKRNFLLVPVLAASLLATTTFAHAQPDPNNAPKGANPPAVNPGGMGGMMGMGNFQNMTPEQRRAAMLNATEQMLRMSMNVMGFPDKPIQDAVVATAMEHEKSLSDVREKYVVVAQGLRGQLTDEQMTTALADLETAQDEAAEDRKAQLQLLDQKIDYSHKPRLKAFLSLVGVTGDDSAQIGGVMGNITSAMTNLMVAQGPNALAAFGAGPQARPKQQAGQ